MYRENPAGPGRIWLAEHDGRIVGHTAIVPVMMKICGETLIGFQAIDTMTHPNYRRQGIYETLAKKAYAEAAKENMQIGYRFPNESNRRIAIKKLNWFDVASTHIMLKPINWRNAIKMRVGNRLLLNLGTIGGNLASKVFYKVERVPVMHGLAIRQVPSFDERINEFWTKVSNQHHIMVVRNKDHLNWRYATVPGVDYQIYIAEKSGGICGYLVLRYTERDGVKKAIIFDVLAVSEQITRCLLLRVIEDCQQEKADLIAFNLIANKTYLTAFRKSGFISSPFLRGVHFCAYSSDPHISKDFLKDPQHWYTQPGDSDAL